MSGTLRIRRSQGRPRACWWLAGLLVVLCSGAAWAAETTGDSAAPRLLTIGFAGGPSRYTTKDDVRRGGDGFTSFEGNSSAIVYASLSLSPDLAAGVWGYVGSDEVDKQKQTVYGPWHCEFIIFCYRSKKKVTIAEKEVISEGWLGTLTWEPGRNVPGSWRTNRTWGTLLGAGPLTYSLKAKSQSPSCEICDRSGSTNGYGLLLGGYRDIPFDWTRGNMGYRFGAYYMKADLPKLNGLSVHASSWTVTIELRGTFDLGP